MYVGAPTPFASWAGRILPGVFDRYLAHTNYEVQQTDIPIALDRPSYLWDPLPGDPGAHGIVGEQARRRSLQFALTSHRRIFVAVGVTLALAGRRVRRR